MNVHIDFCPFDIEPGANYFSSVYCEAYSPVNKTKN
jgi:hypothetical protein